MGKFSREIRAFIADETEAFREKVLLVPFFPIFIALVSGVLAGTLVPSLPFCALCALPLVLLLGRKLPGTLLFLLGAALPWLQDRQAEIPHNVFLDTEISVADSVEYGKYLIDVLETDGQPVEPQRILFVYGNELHTLLAEGDTVRLPLMFESLRSSSIRGKGRFEDLGIETYAHTHPDSIPAVTGNGLVRPAPLFRAKSFFVSLRDRLGGRLDSLDIAPENRAVVKAIVLGSKRGIPPEKRDAYSLAGISHILAISGLHIGMICLLLNLLFLWVPNGGTPRTVKQATIILFLLFYTLLVGASPSVCRATFMCCLLQYAFIGGKSKYRTYNILFASAVLLVLLDRHVLGDIGFQLSYAAVFAILFFYERFALLLPVRSKFLRFFTDILLVTVSVQLLTAPIVLYYFGNFSLVSAFANVTVTLLMPALVIATFLYLAVPNPAAEAAVRFITGAFDKTVETLTAVPFGSFSGFYVTTADLAVYVLLLGAVFLYFAYFFKME